MNCSLLLSTFMRKILLEANLRLSAVQKIECPILVKATTCHSKYLHSKSTCADSMEPMLAQWSNYIPAQTRRVPAQLNSSIVDIRGSEMNGTK